MRAHKHFWALMTAATVSAGGASLAAEPEAEKHFVLKVLPLFKEKCLACHGDDPKKFKGGFDMRTPERFFSGGDSEKNPVVPGKPDESVLYIAVTRTDSSLAMPPKENDKLSEAQVEVIKRWILEGGLWPDAKRIVEITEDHARAPKSAVTGEAGMKVPTSGGLSHDWTNRLYKTEDLWAYAPLRAGGKDEPQENGNPIDRLIGAKMKELGVEAGPLADRRTLIRRATFDLTGLPPTPQEVAQYLADPASEEEAFAKLVDRLLASPHYGEHWARHWLDVVRYADSSGFANDYERGNTWRYRDYVIRAFNEDKPYDQFIREQIAGDELPPDRTKTPESERLIATGFLRMGPWELTGMEVPKVARQRFLDDVTDIVGQAFLGHTLQCARCHDHKFDPVPTQDYYAMQACFATTQLSEREAPFLPAENTSGFEEIKYLEMRRAEHLASLRRLDEVSLKAAEAWFKEKNLERSAWDATLAKIRTRQPGAKANARREFVGLFDAARNALQQQGVPEAEYPPKNFGFSVEDYGHERIARKGLERLRWEMERYAPYAFAVYAGRTPALKSVNAPLRVPAARLEDGELENTAILAGGDPFSPKTPVKPGTLSALGGRSAVIPEAIEGRRLALADWIASADNPLTTRSIVNRLWQWHFGRPIAGNPNNFGATGKKPTHPELLDWLANRLVKEGWSIKAMHRVIMMSGAYRRSAGHPNPEMLKERDPHGVSYAAFQPRRLTAEEVRDAMLLASGELNPTLGGIPARPEINLEAALQPRQVMGTFAPAWQPNPLPAQRHRRSIYVLKLHGLRDPFMEVFNEPTPEFSCEGRDASNVTPQVFSLFNSAATFDRALQLARRVHQNGVTEAEAITALFLHTCGRPPTELEQQKCLGHWETMTRQHEGLTLPRQTLPTEVVREAVEENTGEKFTFTERLHVSADYQPDLVPGEMTAKMRGLAEVALVLFNSNEFAFVY